jgi:hypothetical protein
VNQKITTPAASITKVASKQTYYTIRLLVDRERVEDAYRAYGYFRWVDDTLNAVSGSDPEARASSNGKCPCLKTDKVWQLQCHNRYGGCDEYSY